MAIPWNIRRSASQIFFQDQRSSQYEALLVIANVPHPDRSTLGAFTNDAVDPQEAARYFLHITDGSKAPPEKPVSQFLLKWEILIEKFRPTLANPLSSKTKMLVYERDGGRCCLTRLPFKSYLDRNLEYVHLVSPRVFTDPALSEGVQLLEVVHSTFSGPRHERSERTDNIWLLSTQAFGTMQKGEVFFTVQTWETHPDTTRLQTYNIDTNMSTPQPNARLSFSTDTMRLEKRTPELTPIPNEKLLGLHARFSKSLAWVDTGKYMDMSRNGAIGKGQVVYTGKESFLPSLTSPLFRLFRQLWVVLPSFVRASVYDGLLRIGSCIYGHSLSITVYKLPFGLYLRRGSSNWLKSRQIPAPRAIDVLESSRFSYLLMTCVPGRPVGQLLDTMTDEQVKQVNLTSASKGGGILDWRVPDSQREELRFETEADFNKHLTDPFWEAIRRDAAKSHDIRHDIVFTHGDLNPRNILAENGKITGIVDWENAGWFPEYWEYTKAHYSVRSLMRWLANVIDQAFEGYRDELVVENMLSDLLGPF
ncbi:kinase-like protein [Aspergillus californicus]